MQFEHQKDFILRRATGSDRAEILDLVQKSSGSGDVTSLSETFAILLKNPDVLFDVALNSNGVLIAVLVCSPVEWKVLAANPNFLKKELKEVLLNRVKEFATSNAKGKLNLREKLISGDWKAFIKSQGVNIGTLPNGSETIQF